MNKELELAIENKDLELIKNLFLSNEKFLIHHFIIEKAVKTQDLEIFNIVINNSKAKLCSIHFSEWITPIIKNNNLQMLTSLVLSENVTFERFGVYNTNIYHYNIGEEIVKKAISYEKKDIIDFAFGFDKDKVKLFIEDDESLLPEMILFKKFDYIDFLIEKHDVNIKNNKNIINSLIKSGFTTIEHLDFLLKVDYNFKPMTTEFMDLLQKEIFLGQSLLKQDIYNYLKDIVNVVHQKDILDINLKDNKKNKRLVV